MSMELIFGQEEILLPWAAEKIGLLGKFDRDAHCIGLGHVSNPKAVVVFENFSECGCYVHIASSGGVHWPRGFFRVVCAYPFVQLGLDRVTGMVFAKNANAINFCTKFGFVKEGVMRRATPDDDMIIFGMLREECRWL